MPIYEYRCSGCRRRVSVLVQGLQNVARPECPNCGSRDLTRLFSTFSVGKGDTYLRKGIYEDILSDSRLVRGLEQNDPRALAEWNRKLGQASGQETGPEYADMLGRLEAGESPEDAMAGMESSMGSGEED